MNYYSSTMTEEPVKEKIEVKFSSNGTHHVVLIPWEHCHKDNMTIKVTNSPFKVEAKSFDGMNHHGLEFSLTLNHDIVTLSGTFYDFDEKGFRIHIPKENMKLRKVETASIPYKK